MLKWQQRKNDNLIPLPRYSHTHTHTHTHHTHTHTHSHTHTSQLSTRSVYGGKRLDVIRHIFMSITEWINVFLSSDVENRHAANHTAMGNRAIVLLHACALYSTPQHNKAWCNTPFNVVISNNTFCSGNLTCFLTVPETFSDTQYECTTRNNLQIQDTQSLFYVTTVVCHSKSLLRRACRRSGIEWSWLIQPTGRRKQQW